MNAEPDRRFIARLRLAGMLVITGLGIEILTLLGSHPVSFIVFMVPGAALVMAGFVALVWATVAR